eukprot:gene14579-31037_t
MADKKRRLIMAIIFSSTFMIIELVGGIMAQSLAVLSDAAHLLTDVFGFSLALMAAIYAASAATKDFTYGLGRAEAVGALGSILTLWIMTSYLLYAATIRAVNWVQGTAEPVDGRLMFFVACLGVLVNIALATIFSAEHGAGGFHDHDHSHGHGHGHEEGHAETGTRGYHHAVPTHDDLEMQNMEHNHDHHDNGHSHDHDHKANKKQPVHEAEHNHDHGHKHTHHDHDNHHACNHDHSHNNHNDEHGHDHGHGHGHGHDHQESKNTTGHGHGHDHSHQATENQSLSIYGLHPLYGAVGKNGMDETHNDVSHILQTESSPAPLPCHTKPSGDVNIEAAYLHVVTDLVQSVGVAIAGLIIWIYPTYQIVDPLCTFMFSGLVMFSTFSLFRRVMTILFEGSPAH